MFWGQSEVMNDKLKINQKSTTKKKALRLQDLSYSERYERVLQSYRLGKQDRHRIVSTDQFNDKGIIMDADRIIQVWIKSPFHGIQGTLNFC